MILHNLDTQNSVLKQFISELRDITIQKDQMRFIRNIERIGEILVNQGFITPQQVKAVLEIMKVNLA